MIQRIIFCLFILAAAFQSVHAQGKPAKADDDFSAEYFIVAKHSGKVLDVKEVSKNDHAQIWQWKETKTNNQRWYFLPTDDGVSYYIVSKNSKKCMEFKDGSIQQEPLSWKDEQKWELQPTGSPNEYIIISKKNEGLSLNVAGANKNDGAKVILYSIDNIFDNSVWLIQKAD
jgi:hypothetical protein